MMESWGVLFLCFLDFVLLILWLTASFSARHWRHRAERLAVELRQRSAVVWSLAERCCRQSELLAGRALRARQEGLADPQDDIEEIWDEGSEEVDE